MFSRKRPRWGYRQAHQHLLQEGWSINRKRVQRLWREEGLRVPQKRRKRQRRGESTVPGDRLRAQRPDHVWAFDFQFDVTEDGRAVKLLYVVDVFTREALAMEAERRIDGDQVVDVLEGIVAEQGRRPELVRCDNGPEMTSNALRDWCRFSRTGAAFIEPGSPWENPFVESFNSRVRDELLSVEMFSCLTEAKVMIEDFRQDYNRYRPHRAHRMMTPTAFRTGWETAHEAAPASAELSGSRGGCPPRLPQNRTCAVRIRLFGAAGCEPRRRPVIDLDLSLLQGHDWMGRGGEGWAFVLMQPGSRDEPAVREERVVQAVIDGRGVTEGPRRLLAGVDRAPR